MRLRDYQDEALASVDEAYNQGTHRVLVCLATGLGKTVLMAALPLHIKPRQTDVMVILVNRDELVLQTVDKLKKVHPNGKVGIEKANLRADGDCEFVVASVQTLHEKRLEDFYIRFGNKIGILLIDECHHSTALSYRKITDKLFEVRPDALLVGVTATPQRSDGEGLGIVFDKVVFHRDMKWAIENGYLVPVQSFKITSEVNLDNIKTIGGDFAVGELAEAVDTITRNDLAVAGYMQHTPGKQAIAFCSTVKHAEHLADAFNSKGIKAAWASGNNSKEERNSAVGKFRRGEINVLVNCALFVEGFDVPSTEVMIDCRPTQSSSMYTQMVGRSLRPLDEIANKLGLDTTAEQRRNLIAQSKKPIATILDIVDQTKKHNLVSLPTLYGLPPKFDAQGYKMERAVEEYEKLAAQDPVAAKTVTSIKDIQTALERIEIFTVPIQPPEVIEVSSMSWRMIATNHYKLSLPTFYEATDSSGNSIKGFSKKYRAKISEAKRKGAYPFEEYAQGEIGYNPKTLKTIHENIEIKPGVMSAFDVFLVRGEKPRILGSVDTFHDAFGRAEAWIEHNREDLSSALSAKAGWRDKELTKNQMVTLREKFKVPIHLIPETRGDASQLITKLIDEKRWAKTG